MLPLLPNSTDKYYDTAVDKLQATKQFIKKDSKEGINILGVYEVTLKGDINQYYRNRYKKSTPICNNCKDIDLDKLSNKLSKDTKFITLSISRQYKLIKIKQSNNICVCNEFKKIYNEIHTLSNSVKSTKSIQFINHVNKDVEIYYKPKDFNIYTDHINKCKKMTIKPLKVNGSKCIRAIHGDEFIIGYFSNKEFIMIRKITIDMAKDCYYSIIIKT